MRIDTANDESSESRSLILQGRQGEDVKLTVRTRRVNLGTKFMMLTSSLVLITALVIGLFVIKDEQRDNYELLLHHGRSLMIMIAQNTASAIHTGKDKRCAVVSCSHIFPLRFYFKRRRAGVDL